MTETKIAIAGGNDNYLIEAYQAGQTSADIKGISAAGDHIYEAVRAYSKADIFDAYHDAGYKITSITSGYGSIKPKLYNTQSK